MIAMKLGIFENQQLEAKSAMLFGITALVISFVLGLLAGNNIGFVLLRTLMLSLVFAGIGFGVIVVLRKFVPEFIEMIESVQSPKDEALDEDVIIDQNVEMPSSDISFDSKESEKVTEKVKFEPFGKEDFVNISSQPSFTEGKLGKHFIDEKKKIKYEPKIIAEAIRTMIRRDE